MKINKQTIMFLPKTRYFVTLTGVSAIGFDKVSGVQVKQNVSKLHNTHSLIDMIHKYGCGKQYI